MKKEVIGIKFSEGAQQPAPAYQGGMQELLCIDVTLTTFLCNMSENFE
jgi:hypothetical protein